MGLDITATETQDWTEEEKKKLVQQRRQAKLFAANDGADIAMLRKIPFDFHYRYAVIGPDRAEAEARHKIVDWEAGALYWNVRRTHRDKWEAPFREKLERNCRRATSCFSWGRSTASRLNG